MGNEIKSENRFAQLDAIVPVPLHPKKMQQRGYNQSELLAQGLAKQLNVPLHSHWLQRRIYTTSQTRKGRYERWENVSEAFICANMAELLGSTLLLVDDVLTTGATLEACAKPLRQAGATVSIATLACSLR